MNFTHEQMIDNQKAHVDNLFGLTHKALESIEQLAMLNIRATKTALQDAAQTAQATWSAKDANELLSLHVELWQPAAEKAIAYNRHLYYIAINANAEVGKLVEATASNVQQKFAATVDAAIKNAPAGTEGVSALLKSTVATANNAYESVSRAARQAVDIIQANHQALVQTAGHTPQTPPRSRR